MIASRFLTKKTYFALLLFISLSIGIFFPIFPHLVIQDGETNEIIFKSTIQANEKFSIKYIHSIHLTPVQENYTINENLQIVLQELHFDTYSVGMPSELQEGETLELKNGKIIIKHMNTLFPSINLRVGQVKANHQIMIKGQTVPFSNFSELGAFVKINGANLSLYQLLAN